MEHPAEPERAYNGSRVRPVGGAAPGGRRQGATHTEKETLSTGRGKMAIDGLQNWIGSAKERQITVLGKTIR
jgi:hypothetical protein